MAVSARRGAPLSIEEISSAALRLMDAGGVEGLSMRKLAAELDVNPMSLYHHVASKDALVELICATATARMRLPADDDAPWQEQLRALALAYHQYARQHPALWIHIHNNPRVIADRTMPLWQVLDRILRLAGVPEGELRRTSDVLHAFVSGLILSELQGHLPEEAGEIERSLGLAVELIVRGLEGVTRPRG
ncbi:TetR/AcrR family transcriptional regulator [Nonomuraea sp. NPDC050783]|uniref:TetR/AcrR family transcriptional regulator n=1 Tax=Nonomuraea sp. NPDC050783 TaxID=3154634 RepID=UPI0034652760